MTAPKLRLAGFKEPWSPKRLGATGRILHERTSDFARYPLYSLTIEKGVTKKTERYERGFLVSKTGDIFKIVHPGNFVTNPMNLRFGAVGYSKEKDDVSVSGYYDVFELDDNKCSPFWFNFLKRGEMKKRYEDIATGSLIEKKRVHVNDLLDLELSIPELDERKSIGEYLTSIDRLIDAEVLRLESLRKLKVACLEKMFVHDGEKCPRLRLGEFKDDWKECHLGDVASFRRGLTYSPNDVNGKGVRVLRSSNIVGDHFELSHDDVFVNMDAVDIPCANDGDILITAANGSSALIGKHCVINGVASNSCVPGGFMVLATPRVNSWYLNACMSSSWYRNRIRVHSAGGVGTITNLNKSAIEEFVFSMPQSTQEQNAIGEFFEQLDKALRLLISEIGRLREMKSACMERMFV